MTKITKLPITHKQRQINLHDFGYVPCEVSGRYLQLQKNLKNSVSSVWM